MERLEKAKELESAAVWTPAMQEVWERLLSGSPCRDSEIADPYTAVLPITD